MNFHSAAPYLGGMAILSGGVTIAAHYAWPGRRWLIYLFKPLTTCLILGVALVASGGSRSTYSLLIAVALVFCLAGDIWLMLPEDRFITGLASFLLANVIYSFAFAGAIRSPGLAWTAVPVVLVGAFMLWYLWPGLKPSRRGPVSAYVVVMVAACSLAIYRASGTPSAGAVSAAVGAALYLISDAMLAINRFRRPFHLAQALILSTYFAGLLLIASSAGA